ncbi:glycosyltransferase family 2 protein [Luteimonas dalianensis]|uniref:glycosyltransferase family 2 protein n=1 Tax=Luteimonas dalianensis TaxID=1148196 RepID=UPI003BF0CD4B
MQEPVADLKGLFAPLSPQPLVSVVMTTFNSAQTLEAGVRSLLEQTYRNIEVIVSDDGSTDGTLEIARRLCEEDDRVTLLRFGGNHGTYWAKNFGISRCCGEVVTFADSDDTSDARRIELQLEALRSPGAAVSTCAYSRVDELGGELPIPGSRGFAFISQMIRRDVLEVIGFFDSVRTSADDEMLNRILIAFGVDSHVIVSKRLYTAVVREGSLSHNKDNPRYSPVTKGLSPPRRAYAEGFRAWHARVLEAGAIPYIPFPVTNRPFPVDPRLAVREGDYDSNFISVVAFGSEAGAAPALSELGRQCERAASCRRSWAQASGLEGERWKVHVVADEAEAMQLVRSRTDFPAGHVLFCDLAIAVPGDFIERAIARVERSGRTAPLAAAGAAGEERGAPGRSLHGAGGHTEGGQAGASREVSQPVAKQGAGKAPPPAPARPPAVADGEPAVAGMEAEPRATRAEAARAPGRVRRMTRDFIALGKQFTRLWSRSEQAVALLLGAGAAVLLLGLLLQWSWLSGLGTAGMLGAIGLAVLMSTRRARLLANPEHRAASHLQISSLVRSVNVFRQTHLGRGPAVMPIEAVPAQMAGIVPAPGEAENVPAPVALDVRSEVVEAIRKVGGLSPSAALAQISGIEDRYMLAPDAQGAIAALRAALLAQAGRAPLAKAELGRLEAGDARSRQWVARARGLVEDPAPVALEKLVDEIVGKLQEAA